MSEFQELIRQHRDNDEIKTIQKARWYIVIAAALAAASAGTRVPQLYKEAISSLSHEDEMAVQRRMKEAILKTSCLYGVPRSLQALLPLFAILDDDHIDQSGPRYESSLSAEAAVLREKRGRQYFDTLWTPEAAQFHRDRNFKFQPDLYLLNLKMIYEWHFSEDSILSNVETQMCNVAALICSNCPVQAKWHTKGIIRHGGSIEDAVLAYGIGTAVAKMFICDVGSLESIENIDFEDKSPH